MKKTIKNILMTVIFSLFVVACIPVFCACGKTKKVSTSVITVKDYTTEETLCELNLNSGSTYYLAQLKSSKNAKVANVMTKKQYIDQNQNFTSANFKGCKIIEKVYLDKEGTTVNDVNNPSIQIRGNRTIYIQTRDIVETKFNFVTSSGTTTVNYYTLPNETLRMSKIDSNFLNYIWTDENGNKLELAHDDDEFVFLGGETITRQPNYVCKFKVNDNYTYMFANGKTFKSTDNIETYLAEERTGYEFVGWTVGSNQTAFTNEELESKKISDLKDYAENYELVFTPKYRAKEVDFKIHVYSDDFFSSDDKYLQTIDFSATAIDEKKSTKKADSIVRFSEYEISCICSDFNYAIGFDFNSIKVNNNELGKSYEQVSRDNIESIPKTFLYTKSNNDYVRLDSDATLSNQETYYQLVYQVSNEKFSAKGDSIIQLKLKRKKLTISFNMNSFDDTFANSLDADYDNAVGKIICYLDADREYPGGTSVENVTLKYGTPLKFSDGKLYSGQTVIAEIKCPDDNQKYAYLSQGWVLENPDLPEPDSDFNLSENITVSYKLERSLKTYTVTWFTDNVGGIELTNGAVDKEVVYGTTVLTFSNDDINVQGNVVKKDSTVDKVYTFNGNWKWCDENNVEVTRVTGKVTCIAQYDESDREYTIMFDLDNGTVKTVTIVYGADVLTKINNGGTEDDFSSPEKDKDEYLEYSFKEEWKFTNGETTYYFNKGTDGKLMHDGKTVEFTEEIFGSNGEINSDITITAVYEQSERIYYFVLFGEDCYTEITEDNGLKTSNRIDGVEYYTKDANGSYILLPTSDPFSPDTSTYYIKNLCLATTTNNALDGNGFIKGVNYYVLNETTLKLELNSEEYNSGEKYYVHGNISSIKGVKYGNTLTEGEDKDYTEPTKTDENDENVKYYITNWSGVTYRPGEKIISIDWTSNYNNYPNDSIEAHPIFEMAEVGKVTVHIYVVKEDTCGNYFDEWYLSKANKELNDDDSHIEKLVKNITGIEVGELQDNKYTFTSNYIRDKFNISYDGCNYDDDRSKTSTNYSQTAEFDGFGRCTTVYTIVVYMSRRNYNIALHNQKQENVGKNDGSVEYYGTIIDEQNTEEALDVEENAQTQTQTTTFSNVKHGTIVFVEGNTIYLLSEKPTFVVTSDVSYQSGKFYYTKSGEVYTPLTGTTFQTGITYYESTFPEKVNYISSGDINYDPTKEYYTRTNGIYTKFEGTEFSAGTIYYNKYVKSIIIRKIVAKPNPENKNKIYSFVEFKKEDNSTYQSLTNADKLFELERSIDMQPVFSSVQKEYNIKLFNSYNGVSEWEGEDFSELESYTTFVVYLNKLKVWDSLEDVNSVSTYNATISKTDEFSYEHNGWAVAIKDADGKIEYVTIGETLIEDYIIDDNDGYVYLVPTFTKTTNTYAIRFNNNGGADACGGGNVVVGSNSGDGKSFYYSYGGTNYGGEKNYNYLNNPTRIGYTFLGWAITDSGNVECYYDNGTPITKLSNQGENDIAIKANGEFVGDGDKLSSACHVGADGNLTDVILYAVWVPNVYKITIKMVSDAMTDLYIGGETSQYVIYGLETDASVGASITNPFSRVGYYHNDEWNNSANVETKTIFKLSTGVVYGNAKEYITDIISDIDVDVDAKCVDVYPVWEETAYTINFDYNKQAGTSTEPNKANGTSKNVNYESVLKLEEETRTGYKFSGWKCCGYDVDDKNLCSEVNLYPDVFGLSTYEYAKDVLGANEKTKTITFTAQWTPITYTIAFDLNDVASDGGVGSTVAESVASIENVEFDATQDLSGKITSRIGYNFTGWFASKNGEETSVTEVTNATTTDGDTVTYYARWNARKYKVVYNLNDFASGGVGSTVATNSDEGDADVELQATFDSSNDLQTIKRIGYKFDGWYIGEQKYTNVFDNTNPASEMSGDSANTNLCLNPDASDTTEVTLIAKWTPITYTIAFDLNDANRIVNLEKRPNGSTVATKSDDSVADIELQATFDSSNDLQTIKRVGYKFDGWIDKDNNPFSKTYESGVNVCENPEADGTSEVTLTAQWTALTYIVKFDVNDKTKNKGSTEAESISDTIFTFDVSENLSSTSRIGYIFDGWYIGEQKYTNVFDNTNPESNRSGDSANTNLCLSPKDDDTSEVTLTAKWTAQTYSVKINDTTTYYTKFDSTKFYDSSSFTTEVFIDNNNETFKKAYKRLSGIKLSSSGSEYSGKSANRQMVAFGEGGNIFNAENFGISDEDQQNTIFKKETTYIIPIVLTLEWKTYQFKTYLNYNSLASNNGSTQASAEANSGKFYYAEKIDRTTDDEYYIYYESTENVVLSVDDIVLPASIVREGYTFNTWTYSNLNGTEYTTLSDAVESYSQDLTDAPIINIKANWTANIMTITFNLNDNNAGGVGSTVATAYTDSTKTQKATQMTFKFDSAYKVEAVASRGGYIFEGWKTSLESEDIISATDELADNNITSLVASWKVRTYCFKVNVVGWDKDQQSVDRLMYISSTKSMSYVTKDYLKNLFSNCYFYVDFDSDNFYLYYNNGFFSADEVIEKMLFSNYVLKVGSNVVLRSGTNTNTGVGIIESLVNCNGFVKDGKWVATDYDDCETKEGERNGNAVEYIDTSDSFDIYFEQKPCQVDYYKYYKSSDDDNVAKIFSYKLTVYQNEGESLLNADRLSACIRIIDGLEVDESLMWTGGKYTSTILVKGNINDYLVSEVEKSGMKVYSVVRVGFTVKNEEGETEKTLYVFCDQYGVYKYSKGQYSLYDGNVYYKENGSVVYLYENEETKKVFLSGDAGNNYLYLNNDLYWE